MSPNVGNGPMVPTDTTSEFNAMSFIIDQALARVRTMVLVKVVAVSNNGGLAPVGTVDVQPMVNMLDGSGNSQVHGLLTGLPYTRIQGGKNAIILDPEVGDIGWAAVSDHDISAVKSQKKISNPGSMRVFDMMDAVYIGGILNGTPNQYVQVNDTGITLADNFGNKVQMENGGMVFTGPCFFLNTVEFAGSVQADASVTVNGAAHVLGSLQVDTNATVNGTMTILGLLSGAVASFSGALSALSAAITNAITGDSVQAVTTVKSNAGAHSLGTHVHGYSAPTGGSTPANTAGPTG